MAFIETGSILSDLIAKSFSVSPLSKKIIIKTGMCPAISNLTSIHICKKEYILYIIYT